MYHKDLLKIIHEAQAMGEYGIAYTLWVAAFENALDKPQCYDLVYEYSDDLDYSERNDYYDLLVVRCKSVPHTSVRIPVPLIKENYVRAFLSVAITEEKDGTQRRRIHFEKMEQYNESINRLLKAIESIKSEYDLMGKAHQYLREDLKDLYFTGATPRVYGVAWVPLWGKIKLQRINPERPRQTYASRIAEQKSHLYCSECKFYTNDYDFPCAVNPFQFGVINASVPHCIDKEL